MIVLGKNLKKVLYWALTITIILASFEAFSSIFAVYGSVLNYDKIVVNQVSAYGATTKIVTASSMAISAVLYLVFLLRSLYCLKRDNFFNVRNAYMLVCIAGVGLLTSIIQNLSAIYIGIWDIYATLPYFLATIAPSAFMMCIALLYLAAVRSEESERLTI